ncbi:MAG: hypothetical protein IIZ39_10310 [Blautia sp.]|nr:hypothetical protein [Blautia sp.]
MKRTQMAMVVALCSLTLGFAGGRYTKAQALPEEAWESESFAEGLEDKDFSELDSAKEQEKAYDYRMFFLPEVDGFIQPFVGDTMPYYEDGTFYIYYLKEGGDSYNHSIYLATTQDFTEYTEVDDPLIVSSDEGQDRWIGTGSVVKVQDTYYFFYTGHTSPSAEGFAETVMVAKGTDLYSFEKVEGWEIIPDDSLGQRNDFRDPQGYYDEENDEIILTITASQDGVARILKYTLSSDLSSVTYDGIIFSDPTEEFWNLECSDTFQIGDTYYLTYSGQDDTLWYAASDHPYGPYGEAHRLDDKLFYSAKHVEGPEGVYMVGWARRSESVNSNRKVSAWAGNVAVQEVKQRENGELYLAPVSQIEELFDQRRRLQIEEDALTIDGGYHEVFTAYERFLLKGSFTYTREGIFGLSFDYDGTQEKVKTIEIHPSEQSLSLYYNEGKNLITETMAELTEGEEYSFTYLQEGSVGIFYLDEIASLTVRIYGVSGKPVSLFAKDCEVSFQNLREYTSLP